MAKAAWPKLLVRLDPSLHRKVKVLASLQGISIDSLVAGMLAQWVEENSRQAAQALAELLGVSTDSPPRDVSPSASTTAVFQEDDGQEATDTPSGPRPKAARRRKLGMQA